MLFVQSINHRALRQQLIPDFIYRTHQTTRVIPQIQNQPLHAVLLQCRQCLLELAVGVFLKTADGNIPDFVLHHTGGNAFHLNRCTFHGKFLLLIAALHPNRNRSALLTVNLCRNIRKQLSLHILAIHADNHVARLQACRFRRLSRHHAADDNLTVLRSVNLNPHAVKVPVGVGKILPQVFLRHIICILISHAGKHPCKKRILQLALVYVLHIIFIQIALYHIHLCILAHANFKGKEMPWNCAADGLPCQIQHHNQRQCHTKALPKVFSFHCITSFSILLYPMFPQRELSYKKGEVFSKTLPLFFHCYFVFPTAYTRRCLRIEDTLPITPSATPKTMPKGNRNPNTSPVRRNWINLIIGR